MLSIRENTIFFSVCCLTLLVSLLCIGLPNVMNTYQLPVAALIIITLGIPHGATDYLLYSHLLKEKMSKKNIIRFFVAYLAVVFFYGLVWYISSSLALCIFLFISVYHFGQSNWNYIKKISKYNAFLLYSLWGSFVLFTPIIMQWDTSLAILNQIVAIDLPAISVLQQWLIAGSLYIGCILCTALLYISKQIDNQQVLKEALSISLLLLLFANAPLMIGFGFYFVFWHSLSSVFDQIVFYRKKKSTFNLLDYYKNALPLTFVSVIGMALLFHLSQQFSTDISFLSLFFIMLSTITLPHMLLIEQQYERMMESGL